MLVITANAKYREFLPLQPCFVHVKLLGPIVCLYYVKTIKLINFFFFFFIVISYLISSFIGTTGV